MTTHLPLKGTTVVEIGHSVAGPFAGLILAGLGAEVIKIENPHKGDHTRDWGPPYHGDTAVLFGSLNRDKKSVSVDLKDEIAAGALRRFILESADIVIQNLRPGLIDKIGLGAVELTHKKPSLIYCNISAFGFKGPEKDRPGYDPLMQASGGLMSITGEEGRPPVRVGTSLIDMGSGMWAVIAALAALAERQKTGLGGIVDTSLYETALAWMTIPMATYFASGEIPKRHGSAAPQIVPYQVFETADSYLMIAAGNDNLFKRLASKLGHPEWADLEKYATNGNRVLHRDELVCMIQDIIKEKDTKHWAQELDDAGVPNAPLHSADAVATAPQTLALDIIQSHPEAKSDLMGLPINFNFERPPFRAAPPELGASNDLLQKFFMKVQGTDEKV